MRITILGVLFTVLLLSNAMAASPERASAPEKLDTLYVGEVLNVTGLKPGSELKLYKNAEKVLSVEASAGGYAVTKVNVEAGSYELRCTLENGTTLKKHVEVHSPLLEIKVVDKQGRKVKEVAVSALLRFDVEFQMPEDDVVRVRHETPDGIRETLKTTAVSNLSSLKISTKGWEAGTHELWAETISSMSRGLSLTSNVVNLTIRWLEITAGRMKVAEGESIRFVVRALPEVAFRCNVTHPETVLMTPAYDNPFGLELKRACSMSASPFWKGGFAAVTDESGVYEFALQFNKSQTYSVCVEADLDGDGEFGEDGETAKLDIEVKHAFVSLEVPEIGIVGELVRIRGEASGGRDVDIVIDNILELDDVPLADGGVFEVYWDTKGKTARSYVVKAYVDCHVEDIGKGDDVEEVYSELDVAGAATVRLIEPWVAITESKCEVAKGDNYFVKGVAYGADSVDIVIIGPNGFETLPMGVEGGLYVASSEVSYNNEFEISINIPKNASSGVYTAVATIPSCDRRYGSTREGQLLSALLECYNENNNSELDELLGRSPAQLFDYISEATFYAKGSDDKFAVTVFVVSAPYLKIEAVGSVEVGTPITISGTTNRENGTLVAITCISGPTELPSTVVSVEGGRFGARIDTSNAVPGIYRIKAEEEGGKSDEVTIELTGVPPATPLETPMLVETPMPSPSPTGTPTPSPTPPGFEVLLASVAVAAAYLLRAKKRK